MRNYDIIAQEILLVAKFYGNLFILFSNSQQHETLNVSLETSFS
jgi:hypothetical protein